MRSKPTEYLALGNALHFALEMGHKEGPWDLKKVVTIFLKEFRRVVEDDEVFVTWPRMKKHEAEGVEMLEVYDNGIQSGKISTTPLAIEKEFKLPFEEEIVVVGKIDKIERTEQGTFIVTDYKSGGKEPDPWFLTHDLQFTCYAWACQELYGQIPEKLIWHHLRTGKLLETTRTQTDIDELKVMLHNALEMNRQDIRYRVYNAQVCGYCEFKGDVCDDRELEAKLVGEREALKVIQ
jgi:CRISPR/Cas system-associated exonuclease Cas4 (RecB family)